MPSHLNRFPKNRLIVISFAFFGTEIRLIADNFVEGIHICHIPTLDMGVGTGRNQQMTILLSHCIFDTGSGLCKAIAVGVDGDNDHIQGGIEAKMSPIPQIEFKLTEHSWVTTARRSYLATDVYAFFQGNALHQWHKQILVRCVFHKQLDGQSFIH